MRALLSRIATLLIVAETGVGCGNSAGPGSSVLTTLEVTPAGTTLFTVAPGNAVTLSVVAKDQDGLTMVGVGPPSFSSGNVAVADVSAEGTITAVAAGTARITASLTVGGRTRTGTTTVTAQVASANAGVVAPAIAFQPATLDLQAGGTVRWTFESIHHTVTFTTAGAPVDVLELHDGSASRTFPTHGTFEYHCSIHPVMTGVIHVH